MKKIQTKKYRITDFLIKKSPLILLSLILLACNFPVAKVVYQNSKPLKKPIKVGYSQFTYDDKNEFRGNGSIRAYDSTMATIFYENEITFTKIQIPNFKELKDARPEMIQRLCDKHGLNGIFLTQLNIEAVHESMYNHAYAMTNVESELEMQYLNREGVLIGHTQTKALVGFGNSINEKASNSVAYASEVALKKILKMFD